MWVLRAYGQNIGKCLVRLQVGIDPSGCTETTVHGMASALTEGAAVICIDMNAFPFAS